MRLGIDFGTTNSAISLYDGSHLIAIRADPDNENPDVLPSLIYIDRQHQSVEGFAAAMAYLENETGREVRWERRRIGEVEIIAAGSGASPIRFIQDLHALVDMAANGRLMQSVKTALRYPTYDGTRIFDRFYTLDMLIEVLLRRLKTQAEAAVGQPCDDIILGRPVKFSDNPRLDRRAEEILYKAARAAGFQDITFDLEPLAVVHLEHSASEERQMALVFDFGGGTLDLTVAEIGGVEPPDILATRGVLVGGDDLDKAVMASLLKYFGKDTQVGRQRYEFPFEMLDLLTAWQTMPELSQPQFMGRIKEFQRESTNKPAMRALEHLVSRNLGYKLFKEIERCKKELSNSVVTKLRFEDGPIQIREVITREQFEKMIAREVEKVREGIDEVMTAAGVDQVDVVLRTGGSSLVPVFRDMLVQRFGADKLKDLDPLVSVVGGMAVIAQGDRYECPVYAIRYDSVDPVGDIRNGGDSEYDLYRLRVGEPVYGDDDFILTRCPVVLSGLPTIRTATRADNAITDPEFLSFELHRPCRVYVAFDPMASHRPRWMHGFQREDMQLEMYEEWRGERALYIYSKEFDAGRVVLGGNKAIGFQSDHPSLNYTVIVQILV